MHSRRPGFAYNARKLFKNPIFVIVPSDLMICHSKIFKKPLTIYRR